MYQICYTPRNEVRGEYWNQVVRRSVRRSVRCPYVRHAFPDDTFKSFWFINTKLYKWIEYDNSKAVFEFQFRQERWLL